MPRRKAVKNGDIGIENADPEDVVESLMKVCTPVVKEKEDEFTLQDMDKAGLSGKADSKQKRQKVGEILGIGYGNCNTFVKKLNSFGVSRKDFEKAIENV